MSPHRPSGWPEPPMLSIQLLKDRARPVVARVEPVWQRLYDVTVPLAHRARPVFRPVSRLGWTVLVVAFGCWLLGWACGWIELMLLASAALILFVLCGVLLVGRSKLRVTLVVEPQRVVVGTPSAGQVNVVNMSRRAMLPIALELPIGRDATRFNLPLLRGAAEHEELFVVPTQRRGVISVGPAMTVRGDPLGLFRRTVSWTPLTEIFVHPATVPLEALSAGVLRDLEGQTTNDVSMSDLAFHALREYQPGDDRRYIHWRSSAKAGRFMVRQFLDTRRSHIATIVDSDGESYPDADDYELAISAAASVAVRSIQDEQEVTVLAGSHAVPASLDRRVLDTFARAELDGHGLRDLTARAARMAPNTTIALLITGARTSFIDMQRAASHFPPEVRTMALRVDPTTATGVSGIESFTVLTLNSLSELPLLLQGALR